MLSTKEKIKALVDAVCADYGVTLKALRGESKIRVVVEARWVAVYLCNHLTDATLWEIGHYVARYSESTASKQSMKIWRRLRGDQALAERVDRIAASLWPGGADSGTDSVTGFRARGAGSGAD